jgi:hypothetical protein
MNHQRSQCCLGAAPLAAAFFLGSPAEAALAGVTPASDTLQVFAEGAVAAGQGLAAARPRQPGSDRAGPGPCGVLGGGGDGSLEGAGLGVRKPPPGAAQRASRRLTGAGAGVIVTGGASVAVPLGPPSARLAPATRSAPR